MANNIHPSCCMFVNSLWLKELTRVNNVCQPSDKRQVTSDRWHVTSRKLQLFTHYVTYFWISLSIPVYLYTWVYNVKQVTSDCLVLFVFDLKLFSFFCDTLYLVWQLLKRGVGNIRRLQGWCLKWKQLFIRFGLFQCLVYFNLLIISIFKHFSFQVVS